MNDIESRFDSLRQLGFTEQQIVDMVHRELARATRATDPAAGGSGASRTAAGDAGGRAHEPSRSTTHPKHAGTETRESDAAQLRVRDDVEVARPVARVGRRTPREWNPADLVLNVDSHYEHHEWSGPFPHPAFAREYEKLCPGFMDRQLRMQEDELRVRWRVLDRRDARLERGQRYALVAALAVMASGVFIAWLGSPKTGAGLIGGVVVALVSAFLYRQQNARKRAEAGESAGELPEADDKSP